MYHERGIYPNGATEFERKPTNRIITTGAIQIYFTKGTKTANVTNNRKAEGGATIPVLVHERHTIYSNK